MRFHIDRQSELTHKRWQNPTLKWYTRSCSDTQFKRKLTALIPNEFQVREMSQTAKHLANFLKEAVSCGGET